MLLLLSFPILSGAQCSSTAGPCAAGVPHLIRFRGVLKNSPGQEGMVGITFSIYADSSGGTPLWQESQNVRVDQQGGYAVLLGMSKLEGVPPELFSSGEPRWLGIQVAVARRIGTAQDVVGQRSLCPGGGRRPDLGRLAAIGFFEGWVRQLEPVPRL